MGGLKFLLQAHFIGLFAKMVSLQRIAQLAHDKTIRSQTKYFLMMLTVIFMQQKIL